MSVSVLPVPTPARVRRPLFGAQPPEGREARVRAVMGLMMGGRFVRGETGRSLARLWGFSDYYMRDVAAEASRRTKAMVDPEYVRGRLSQSLEAGLGVVDGELQAAAVGAGRCPVCKRSDLDAVKALPGVVNAYRELVGASAASRVELSGPAGGPIAVRADVQAFMLAVVAEVGGLVGGAEALGRLQARLELGEGGVDGE